jgi:bifunctional non-homologous end joining protein LigD
MTTPDLKRYREKRDPARTPEPFGGAAARALPPAAPRAFVVQQHAARRTHWDLRLEVEGVLASWAVPKGPSLDPAQRRLAVRTEDHPLDYAHFEGVIPKGNYGAGAMIVWDAGAYRTHDAKAPAAALEEGKLDLELFGHKLRGRFALVRTRGGEGRDWLLIRKGAPPAEAVELVEREPGSVLSGLTVEELAAGESRDAQVEQALRRLRAPRRPLRAGDLRPMLATTVDEPFSRKGWLFELKYDGVRVIASKDAEGRAGLSARSGRDVTALYPEVARALRHLPLAEFAIDGELVAPDERGVASFERIQRRFTQVDLQQVPRLELEFPVLLYAFDCLSALGRDLRGLALVRRKELLSLFCPRLAQVRFADHVEGDGEALFEAAREHALEGIVAKRAESRYESGRRSKSWQKVKVPRSACLVVVGLLPGKGSRAALGSLMLAWHREGELRYAGNAGSGLGEAGIREILEASADRARPGPAFAGAPDPLPRGATFVEPALVCEVRYSEVTSAGLLRHPVFLKLRPDLTPQECRAPAALEVVEERRATETASQAAGAQQPAETLQLTRLDKVFWPVEGFTKGDLLAYYEAVWPWLSPYLRDRPVVLTRYPDGIEGKSFYQKNAPEFTPEWVERRSIDGSDYFLCNDLRTLLYVVNSGAIPLHVWHARVDRLDRPDWLVLDLDPKEAPFAHVVRIARHLHALLRELGAAHFAKTSGQAGLHVLLPLGGSLSHQESRALAEVIARCVCAELPEIATVARPLAARADKVYVDFLQNGRGKLIASPLSVRPRPGAPLSMPLFWTQVTARLDPARWNIESAVRQLERRGDPFRGVLGEGVDVPALLARLERRVGEGAG